MHTYRPTGSLLGGADIIRVSAPVIYSYIEARDEYAGVLHKNFSLRLVRDAQPDETVDVIFQDTAIEGILADLGDMGLRVVNGLNVRTVLVDVTDNRIRIQSQDSSIIEMHVMSTELRGFASANTILGFHPSPHPKGVSRRGDSFGANSSRSDRALHSGAFLIRNEDRTSTAINRSLEALSSNIDILEMRTRDAAVTSETRTVKRIPPQYSVDRGPWTDLTDELSPALLMVGRGDEYVRNSTLPVVPANPPALDVDSLTAFAHAVVTARGANTFVFPAHHVRHSYVEGMCTASGEDVLPTTDGRVGDAYQPTWSVVASGAHSLLSGIFQASVGDTVNATMSSNLSGVGADDSWWARGDYLGTIYGPRFDMTGHDDGGASPTVALDHTTILLGVETPALAHVRAGDILLTPGRVHSVDFVCPDLRTIGVKPLATPLSEIFLMEGVPTHTQSTLLPSGDALPYLEIFMSGVLPEGRDYAVGVAGHTQQLITSLSGNIDEPAARATIVALPDTHVRARRVSRDAKSLDVDDVSKRSLERVTQEALDPYTGNISESNVRSLRGLYAASGTAHLPFFINVPISDSYATPGRGFAALDYLQGYSTTPNLRTGLHRYLTNTAHVMDGGQGALLGAPSRFHWQHFSALTSILSTALGGGGPQWSENLGYSLWKILSGVDSSPTYVKSISDTIDALGLRSALTNPVSAWPTDPCTLVELVTGGATHARRVEARELCRQIIQLTGTSDIRNSAGHMDIIDGISIVLPLTSSFSDSDVGRVFSVTYDYGNSGRSAKYKMRMVTWSSPQTARFVPLTELALIEDNALVTQGLIACTIDTSIGYADTSYGSARYDRAPLKQEGRWYTATGARVAEPYQSEITRYTHTDAATTSELTLLSALDSKMATIAQLFQEGRPPGVRAAEDRIYIKTFSYLSLGTPSQEAHSFGSVGNLRHLGLPDTALAEAILSPFGQSSEGTLVTPKALYRAMTLDSAGADVMALPLANTADSLVPKVFAALQDIKTLLGEMFTTCPILARADEVIDPLMAATSEMIFPGGSATIGSGYPSYSAAPPNSLLSAQAFAEAYTEVTPVSANLVKTWSSDVSEDMAATLHDIRMLHGSGVGEYSLGEALNISDLALSHKEDVTLRVGLIDNITEFQRDGGRLQGIYGRPVTSALPIPVVARAILPDNPVGSNARASKIVSGLVTEWYALRGQGNDAHKTLPSTADIVVEQKVFVQQDASSLYSRSVFIHTSLDDQGALSVEAFGFEKSTGLLMAWEDICTIEGWVPDPVTYLPNFAYWAGNINGVIHVGTRGGGGYLQGNCLLSAAGYNNGDLTVYLHPIFATDDLPAKLCLARTEIHRLAPVNKEAGATLRGLATLAAIGDAALRADPDVIDLGEGNSRSVFYGELAYLSVSEALEGAVRKQNNSAYVGSRSVTRTYDGTADAVPVGGAVEMSLLNRRFGDDAIPSMFRHSENLNVYSEEVAHSARVSHGGIQGPHMQTHATGVVDVASNVFSPLNVFSMLVECDDQSGDLRYSGPVTELAGNQFVTPLISSSPRNLTTPLVTSKRRWLGASGVPIVGGIGVVTSDVGIYIPHDAVESQGVLDAELPTANPNDVPYHLTRDLYRSSMLVEGDLDDLAASTDSGNLKAAIHATGAVRVAGMLRVMGDLNATRYGGDNLLSGNRVLAGMVGQVNPVAAPRAQSQMHSSALGGLSNRLLITSTDVSALNHVGTGILKGVDTPGIDAFPSGRRMAFIGDSDPSLFNRNVAGTAPQQLGERAVVASYYVTNTYAEPPVLMDGTNDVGCPVYPTLLTSFSFSPPPAVTAPEYGPLFVSYCEYDAVLSPACTEGLNTEYVLIAASRPLFMLGESHVGRTVTFRVTTRVVNIAGGGDDVYTTAYYTGVVVTLKDSPEEGVTYLAIAPTHNRYDSTPGVPTLSFSGIETNPNVSLIPPSVLGTEWSAHLTAQTELPAVGTGILTLELFIHGREWVANTYQLAVSDRLYIRSDTDVVPGEIYGGRDGRLHLSGADDVEVSAGGDLEIAATSDVEVSGQHLELTFPEGVSINNLRAEPSIHVRIEVGARYRHVGAGGVYYGQDVASEKVMFTYIVSSDMFGIRVVFDTTSIEPATPHVPSDDSSELFVGPQQEIKPLQDITELEFLIAAASPVVLLPNEGANDGGIDYPWTIHEVNVYPVMSQRHEVDIDPNSPHLGKIVYIKSMCWNNHKHLEPSDWPLPLSFSILNSLGWRDSGDFFNDPPLGGFPTDPPAMCHRYRTWTDADHTDQRYSDNCLPLRLSFLRDTGSGFNTLQTSGASAPKPIKRTPILDALTWADTGYEETIVRYNIELTLKRRGGRDDPNAAARYTVASFPTVPPALP